jgi:hypothetical protein
VPCGQVNGLGQGSDASVAGAVGVENGIGCRTIPFALCVPMLVVDAYTHSLHSTDLRRLRNIHGQASQILPGWGTIQQQAR